MGMQNAASRKSPGVEKARETRRLVQRGGCRERKGHEIERDK